MEVNPNGEAVNPRVLRSLGHGLDEKALEAVAKWEFRPGAKDGKPVTVAATIEVNSRLLKNSATEPAAPPKIDPQLHANVVKLFELSGERERLRTAMPQRFNDAKAAAIQQFPAYDPAYIEEYAKRTVSGLNVQDLIDLQMRAYENHFTSDDIAGLLDAQIALKESRPAEVSPKLKEKVASKMPAIQSEMTAGYLELTARLSSQIADDISKAHPEYIPRKACSPIIASAELEQPRRSGCDVSEARRPVQRRGLFG